MVVLGGVAYANFRFKRVDGIEVNTESIQKRDLEGDRLGIWQDPAEALRQHQRRHDADASPSSRSKKAIASSRASSCCRSTRATCARGCRAAKPRSVPRDRSSSRCGSRSTARRTALKQAEDAYRRQQNLAKGGLTTKETLERAENDLNMRKADLASQEQKLRTLQLRTEQEQATLENARTDLSKVRIESPIDGIITRRNVEQGETAVVGTMNNAGTVLLQVADMSIIEAEVEVDETDIPAVTARTNGDDHRRRHQRQDLHRQGHRDRQQPDSDDGPRRRRRRRTSRSHSRSKGRFRTCGPGFTCTAEITTATRSQALAVPIQATTVREMVLDDKGNVVREPVTTGGASSAVGDHRPGLRAETRAGTEGARGRLRRPRR